MRVTNWSRWTTFKKKVSIALILTGILLSFGMEDGSIAYGFWGILVALAGLAIFNTISFNEWKHYKN